MGRKSRTKGHSFEREMANLFRLVFPDARRQLEYHVKDANGVDLQGTGRYRVQCKRCKKYASITAINEIRAEPGTIPVLVTRGDNCKAMAVLPLDELITLIGNRQRTDDNWQEFI